jgi:hypothetical protein
MYRLTWRSMKKLLSGNIPEGSSRVSGGSQPGATPKPKPRLSPALSSHTAPGDISGVTGKSRQLQAQGHAGAYTGALAASHQGALATEVVQLHGETPR